MIGKSPRKLSTHEKTVINGLKQLTEMIFKPHYIQDEVDSFDGKQTEIEQQQQQQENSNDFLAFINSATQPQSKSTDVEQFIDSAMKDAEKFCAMVITTLTSDEEKQLNKDWYMGQLDAYQTASQELFAKDETKNVIRNLREF